MIISSSHTSIIIYAFQALLTIFFLNHTFLDKLEMLEIGNAILEFLSTSICHSLQMVMNGILLLHQLDLVFLTNFNIPRQWLTKPGKYRTYRTGPYRTSRHINFQLKGSENFESLKIKWFFKSIPEIWPNRKCLQVATLKSF